jgi:hypothetical protein
MQQFSVINLADWLRHLLALLLLGSWSFNESMSFQSFQVASAASSLPSGLRQLLFINRTNFETIWTIRNMLKCLLWFRIC